jgi:hypothetical protein
MVTISADGVHKAGMSIKSLSEVNSIISQVLMYLAVVKFSVSVFYFFAD